MIELNPNIRLVVNNEFRKEAQEPKTGRKTASGDLRVVSNQTGEVVELVSQQNRLAATSQHPTADQAAEALSRLREDLPALGQEVGNLHSKLDRRVILTLLAPLVI